jgi:putative phage-type endonuclease
MAAIKTTEWHNTRTKGIGGSEIAAVLGLDPYTTPYALWERKTARVPSSPENANTQRGHYLEPALAAFFADKTGFDVWEEKTRIEHPERPFLIGETDRIFRNDQRQTGVLELKSTRVHVDPENIPLRWFFQAQYYMGILRKKVGAICWIGAGLEMDYRLFPFDKKVWEAMIEAAGAFWNDYVLTDTPPPPMTESDIKKIVGIVEPKTVEADDETVAHYRQLKDNKAKIKELERVNEEHETALKLRMMEADTLMYMGNRLATWKQQEQVRIDNEKVKQALPDTWQELTKKIEVRIFLVK